MGNSIQLPLKIDLKQEESRETSRLTAVSKTHPHAKLALVFGSCARTNRGAKKLQGKTVRKYYS
jgi:hypothetical protein